MSLLNLREWIERILEIALSDTANRPNLIQVYDELQQCQIRLREPMRVAIAGKTSAGKSTLVNASLETELVLRGNLETTFNILWLEYGDPALQVYFKDDRQPEPKSFDDLEILTRRPNETDAEADTYLRSIKCIKVFCPNEILKSFQFIDTAGLNSFYGDDSQNTLDFLSELGVKPDAILYLCRGRMDVGDQKIVEEFQGPFFGQARPLNALGALTQADMHWRSVSDPIQEVQKICRRLMHDYSKVRDHFYDIYPVSGLLAFGAKTLTSKELEILTKLAALPEEDFMFSVTGHNTFIKPDPKIPIPPEERKLVWDRLGQYGVVLACDFIRQDETNLTLLREKLLSCSGFPALWSAIESHFGRSAALIKLNTGLERIKTACFRAGQSLIGEDLQILEKVRASVDEIDSEIGLVLEQLKMLSNYQKEELKKKFTEDEIEQFLTVIGERGMSCAARMGLNSDTTLEEMERGFPELTAHIAHWRKLVNRPGVDRQTKEIARLATRSYERLVYHLRQARYHTEEAKRHLSY